MPTECVEAIPDRWPEGTPLGIRNRMNRSVPHRFLVFPCVVEEGVVPTRTHASKLWPPTVILNSSELRLHLDFSHLSEDEMVDYVHALLFRYCLGIGDLADRNFLHWHGRVVSVDEEMVGKPVNMKTELRKKRCESVVAWLEKNEFRLGYRAWTGLGEVHDKLVREGARSLFEQ